MSTTDSKFEQHRDTEGPARRTFESLMNSRGFQHEPALGLVVSICPMVKRTFWKCTSSGKPTAAGAMYEEVTP